MGSCTGVHATSDPGGVGSPGVDVAMLAIFWEHFYLHQWKKKVSFQTDWVIEFTNKIFPLSLPPLSLVFQNIQAIKSIISTSTFLA